MRSCLDGHGMSVPQCSTVGVLGASSSASDVSVDSMSVNSAAVNTSQTTEGRCSLGTPNDRESWDSGRTPVTAQEPTGSSDAGSAEKSVMDSNVPTDVKQERFYFESDSLVLKDNPDYQKLLKALAVLEAQKMQAIKDMEKLVQTQARAEKDPLGFVEALKSETLEPLPGRQQVAELPDIDWKGYVDSLQLVAKQRSSVYLHTRKHSSKHLLETKSYRKVEISTGRPGRAKSKLKDPNKPPSYRQPWTPEEQTRFEELLQIYPPEQIERRRFEKIAKALGSRTTQQVASHVQKYFIKLAKAGLPVPGRMPNLANYYPKSKKGGRGRRLNRPSMFFSSLSPRVYMPEGDGTSSHEGSLWEDESSDDDSVTSELVPTSEPQLSYGDGTPISAQAVQCTGCEKEIVAGVYWQCSECSKASATVLCSDCVNCDYRSDCHTPSHDMHSLTIVQSCFADKDYTSFTPQSTHTKYNYLDPNFYPAS